MVRSNWLRDAVEETMFKHFVESQPSLVENIKALLQRGEKKSNIKRFVHQTIGNRHTTLHIGHLIDYIDKQVKN